MLTAVWDSCLSDLQSLVQSLQLQGDGVNVEGVGTNVYTELLLERLNISSFPAIGLTVEEQETETGENTFNEDGVIYPAQVSILDQTRSNYQACLPTYLAWRSQVQSYLRGKLKPPILPNTPSCWMLRLRDLKVFDAKKVSQGQVVVMPFVVLCHTRVPRSYS